MQRTIYLGLMAFFKPFLIIFFAFIVVLTANGAEIAVREGQRGSVARVVVDIPAGSILGLAENITSTHLRLQLEGPVCGVLQSPQSLESAYLKEITLESVKTSTTPVPAQCVVNVILHQPRILQKAEIKASATDTKQSRLMLDLRQVDLPTSSKFYKKPLRLVSGSVEVYFVEPGEENLRSPIQDHGGANFDPVILEKPYRPVIVLDPGHGGADPGSVSCQGAYEKAITLASAQFIAAEIKKTGRYHVMLTRTDDTFVAKRQRFSMAREAQADFFISIHADSHPSMDLRGLTIYTLSSTASDKEAERLSKQENQSELMDGLKMVEADSSDVSNVLLDIAQRSSSNTAQLLAEHLHCSLTSCQIGKVMTLRSGDLAVLKAPETPSILIELGYLSNEKDEKLIQTQDYQKKLAESLINALDKYFEKA